MNESIMSQISSATSNPPVSLPSAGKSLEFQPTEEGYGRLLDILDAELSVSILETFIGGKYAETDQKCQMCSPLSDGTFSHRRNEHTVSSVTSLPSKHRLQQLLYYAKFTGLQARVSFGTNCPSYRLLIIGDLPPLSDSTRVKFERDPDGSLALLEGEVSDVRPPEQTAKPVSTKDTRWQAMSKHITLHHTRRVNASLVNLQFDRAMQVSSQPIFDFEDRDLQEGTNPRETLDEFSELSRVNR